MTAYLQAMGAEIWDSVETDYVRPMQADGQNNAREVPKPISLFSEAEKNSLNNNNKAKNALFMALSESEFNRVSSCSTAKEVWLKLITTHEGDAKVKESKLELLTTQFETLRMEEDETFDEYFLRLQHILNASHALGLIYSDYQVICKILRTLPKRFQSRKDVIREAHDLSTMSLETLAGKLRTFELEHSLDAPKPSTSVAFKSSSKASPPLLDDDFDDDEVEDMFLRVDKEMALLSRRLNSLSKWKTKYRQAAPRSSSSSNPPRPRQFNAQSKDKKQLDSSSVQCYRCREYGHFANDCGLRKKVSNPNSSRKRANVTLTLDDSDDSASCDSSDDECANYVVLSSKMRTDSNEHNMVNGDTHLELKQAHIQVLKELTSLTEENISLRSELDDLNENIAKDTEGFCELRDELEKNNNALQEKVDTLSQENSRLVAKVASLEKELDEARQQLSSFASSSNKLDNILTVGRSSHDRRGLGFIASTSSTPTTTPVFVASCEPVVPLNKSSSSSKDKGILPLPKTSAPTTHTLFKKVASKPKSLYVCSYCHRKGHTSKFCWDWVETPQYPTYSSWNPPPPFYGYPPWSFPPPPFHSPSSFSYSRVSQVVPPKRTKAKSRSARKPTKITKVWVPKSSLSTTTRCNVATTVLHALKKSDLWYLDSGCSRHMTGDPSKLHGLVSFQGGNVTFGDGNTSRVIGKGTVENIGLSPKDEVLLVDGLKANLISISQLCDSDYKVNFLRTECRVYDTSGSCVLKGLRSSENCYVVNSPVSSIACHTSKIDNVDLWHQRLGHINYKDLSRLSTKEYIRGVPKLPRIRDVVCGPCQIGKQIRSKHKAIKGNTTKSPLELLHMDLMGPMRTTSLGGKKYILVMVDDYSRYTWVDFLRSKDETFIAFQSICLGIQNEKDTMITRIRSDRGTEFTNSGIIEYCAANGILQEFSSPRTPQQNGVAERKNRTLQEMARVMLHNKGLPNHF